MVSEETMDIIWTVEDIVVVILVASIATFSILSDFSLRFEEELAIVAGILAIISRLHHHDFI